MLQFGLRLLVKGRGKEHNGATMTCQHERRDSGMQAEPPGLSAIGRTERVTERERMELPGEGGSEGGHYEHGEGGKRAWANLLRKKNMETHEQDEVQVHAAKDMLSR